MTADSAGRLFAIVPAAGHSRRMGRPKLLLPLGGRTVVDRLLTTLGHPRVAETVVVARRDDKPLARELEGSNAVLVRPDVDPPDMRASVQIALDHLREHARPDDHDGWMLVPADHPILSRSTLDALVETWTTSPASILVPTRNGRRGHPTIFRWSLAEEVRRLPPDRGLNALLRLYADDVREFEAADDSVVTDLDTPEDYARLLASFADAEGESVG